MNYRHILRLGMGLGCCCIVGCQQMQATFKLLPTQFALTHGEHYEVMAFDGPLMPLAERVETFHGLTVHATTQPASQEERKQLIAFLGSITPGWLDWMDQHLSPDVSLGHIETIFLGVRVKGPHGNLDAFWNSDEFTLIDEQGRTSVFATGGGNGQPLTIFERVKRMTIPPPKGLRTTASASNFTGHATAYPESRYLARP